jgi:cytochrome c peroxidase
VVDPDGDRLIYTFRFNHITTGNPPPPGLVVSGAVIAGTPTEIGAWEVETSVDDGRGGTPVFFRFFLRVSANSAPVLAKPGTTQLLAVGSRVDHDAAQGGTAFVDPDGDPISYEVTLRGAPRGLAVAGTRITGTFAAVGALEATVTARDAYGGVARDAFLFVAPAVEPGAPSLPATSYVYRDEELPLPFVFRMSSESRGPFGDTQPADNRTSNAGATLGRVLFYDKRLSITNTMSCASCHRPANGFASPLRFDVGILEVPMKRNTMALANVRYNLNSAWFADLRARDLEQLVFEPTQQHDELGMTLEQLEAKLQGTSFYPPLFATAFGTPAVTRDRIARAVAQFLRSLISYRSRWDLAFNLMGNDPPNPAAVLNAQELRGFELYRERCSGCHSLAANNNDWQANNGLDANPVDPGALDPALRRDGSRGIFRAASLRNIARTAPYMHDGRFATLREVVDHYDHGIQASRDLDVMLRDGMGNPQRLNLSEADKVALETYLNLLTDDAFLNDPKFANPFG